MVASEGRQMTLLRLEAFRDAWVRGDLDDLMSFMSEDCVYQASVGPEPGETFVGPEAVRAGFAKLLAHDSSRQGHHGPAFVYGDQGVANWSFSYHEGDRRIEIFGCDLFEFSGDKVRVKNAFRKTFDD